MSQVERDCLASAVREGSRIVEFGCGGSTLFFVQQGAARVDSVESDRAWVDKLATDSEIAAAVQAGVVDIRHVDLGPTRSWGAPVDPAHIARWPQYWRGVWDTVAADTVDLVFVDGRFRVACALYAALVLGRDATIAMHDFWNRPHYHDILEFLRPICTAERLGIFVCRADVDERHLLRTILRYAYNHR